MSTEIYLYVHEYKHTNIPIIQTDDFQENELEISKMQNVTQNTNT
jgi:hypothetical protein